MGKETSQPRIGLTVKAGPAPPNWLLSDQADLCAPKTAADSAGRGSPLLREGPLTCSPALTATTVASSGIHSLSVLNRKRISGHADGELCACAAAMHAGCCVLLQDDRHGQGPSSATCPALQQLSR